MFLRIILLGVLCLKQTLFSQQVMITRIVDSNLFEIQASTYIKLAGVDIPRLNNPHHLLRNFANDAVVFENKNLLNQNFTIKVLGQSDKNKLVYLYKKDIFDSKKLNLFFIEEGYGRLINNIDSADLSEFRSAELKARRDNKGIWNFKEVNYNELLDREYTEEERNKIQLDSVTQVIRKISGPRTSHVLGEFFLGSFGGMAAGLLTGMFGVIFSPDSQNKDGLSNESETRLLIAIYSGYLLGNTLGVNAVAGKTSKQITFLETFMASLAGGAIGMGLFYSVYDGANAPPGLLIIPMLVPVISAMIYVNAFAPDKTYESAAKNFTFDYDDLTAAKIYNSTNLIDIELFRLHF